MPGILSEGSTIRMCIAWSQVVAYPMMAATGIPPAATSWSQRRRLQFLFGLKCELLWQNAGLIWSCPKRHGENHGSSIAQLGAKAPRPCCAIWRATSFAWRSPKAASSGWTMTASPSATSIAHRGVGTQRVSTAMSSCAASCNTCYRRACTRSATLGSGITPGAIMPRAPASDWPSILRTSQHQLSRPPPRSRQREIVLPHGPPHRRAGARIVRLAISSMCACSTLDRCGDHDPMQ